MNETQKTEYVVSRDAKGQYGLGEVIIPGVTLFRAGHFDLTYEELQHVINRHPHRSQIKGKK